MLSELWLVRHRRYHSDEWRDEVFMSAAAARTFARNLRNLGPDAQATIKRFIEADRTPTTRATEPAKVAAEEIVLKTKISKKVIIF